MEGIGYWIFLAVLYLLSSLIKKRRKQAIGQQQDKEDPNSTDEVKPNPFQAEFLQDLFRDMKDLVEDPEEIPEDEIENIYVDEEAEEIEPEKKLWLLQMKTLMLYLKTCQNQFTKNINTGKNRKLKCLLLIYHSIV